MKDSRARGAEGATFVAKILWMRLNSNQTRKVRKETCPLFFVTPFLCTEWSLNVHTMATKQLVTVLPFERCVSLGFPLALAIGSSTASVG